MEMQIQLIKELEDGSAICSLELDNDAKEFLIGEGFLAIVKRALITSESYVKPEHKDEKKECGTIE